MAPTNKAAPTGQITLDSLWKSQSTPRKRPLEQNQSNGNSATETAKRPKRDESSVRAQRYVHDEPVSRNVPIEDDDAADKRKREELHSKWVKKLGHPDSMLRRRSAHSEENSAAGEDDEDGGDADEDEAPAAKSKIKGGARANKKLTPMEEQFLDIKRKHMDTVLIVEVGYKFRFFGEDARVAAKELGIVCIPGKFKYNNDSSEAHLDRFASASVPVHRLSVHAKRLVAAGHKVGVVRQIETAALKKAGDNRNAPFVRKLTNIYTKGTYIDETEELSSQGNASGSGGYLLCLKETVMKGHGTEEKVEFGVLAVQPGTGDIIYDSFEDGFMRSEIETRLLHISPCEFLIVGKLTDATNKLIQQLSGSKDNVFGDKCRVENFPRPKEIETEASNLVTKFYANKLKDNAHDAMASELLDKVLSLPKPVTSCLAAMIEHLTEYGLENVFNLTKHFQSFSTRQHMLVSGTTLESLEIYRNSTDFGEKGSLFWAVDQTVTKSGQRLLRKWVGQPLLDKEELEARSVAVEELFDHRASVKVDKLKTVLAGIKKVDLERSLIRIYYGKCTRPELLNVLQTLQKIALVYADIKSPAETGFKSPLIQSAILSLPLILGTVASHLDKISAEAARKNDKYAFFMEAHETEDMNDHRTGICSVEHDLDEQRKTIGQTLKKSAISYVTVAGIEYLVEVPNTELKKVPASWRKISGTKKVSRFHTPEAMRLMTERDQHREAWAAACDDAFAALLKSIAEDYQPLRDVVTSLATLDCLVSLSTVAAQPGYTKPTFLPSTSPPTISITQGRHPVQELILPNGYIPFSTTLASPAPLAHLITGPNMGGKSSFVRAVALIVLLAQIGSFVPAEAVSLTLADAIFTRMGARDNILKGESTFMVELSETSTVLRAATPRSLVILDELGRGTSTHDGAAIAHAVLEHVANETRCLTMFITHYQNLARVADGMAGRIKNLHMRFMVEKTPAPHPGAAEEEEVTFLYEVGEGVAHRSYGMNVARLAGIPRRVRDVAAFKSREMELETRARKVRAGFGLLADVLAGRGADRIDDLVVGIEQL